MLWVKLYAMVLVCGATATFAFGQQPETPAITLSTKLTSLGKDRDDLVLKVPLTSPDSRHVANVSQREGSMRIWIDGVEGPAYDSIDIASIQFGPNGKLAYVARTGGNELLVWDGKPCAQWDKVPPRLMRFSPDGNRFAYVASSSSRKRFVVVVDHETVVECQGVDETTPILFSPNSKRVAVIHQTDREHRVRVDGVDGPVCEAIGNKTLRFSPDGSRFAYGAARNNEQFVIIDGKEGKHYEGCGPEGVFFSPDSKHYLYRGKRGGKQYAVVDGKEGPGFDTVSPEGFSGDGSLLAYRATLNEKNVAVVNGKLGPEFPDGVSPILFSGDGKRYAYIGVSGGRQKVVTDGVEGKEYMGIIVSTLKFSSDGKHLAYVAVRANNEAVIVRDGVEKKVFSKCAQAAMEFSPDGEHLFVTLVIDGKTHIDVDGITSAACESIGGIRFSPDGKRWAYATKRDGVMRYVVNGIEQKSYDRGSGYPVFSPDSKHIAYIVIQREAFHIVVDGVESAAGDGLTLGKSLLIFDGPNKLHGIIARGDFSATKVQNMEFFRIDMEIVEQK